MSPPPAHHPFQAQLDQLHHPSSPTNVTQGAIQPFVDSMGHIVQGYTPYNIQPEMGSYRNKCKCASLYACQRLALKPHIAIVSLCQMVWVYFSLPCSRLGTQEAIRTTVYIISSRILSILRRMKLSASICLVTIYILLMKIYRMQTKWNMVTPTIVEIHDIETNLKCTLPGEGLLPYIQFLTTCSDDLYVQV